MNTSRAPYLPLVLPLSTGQTHDIAPCRSTLASPLHSPPTPTDHMTMSSCTRVSADHMTMSSCAHDSGWRFGTSSFLTAELLTIGAVAGSGCARWMARVPPSPKPVSTARGTRASLRIYPVLLPARGTTAVRVRAFHGHTFVSSFLSKTFERSHAAAQFAGLTPRRLGRR